jgi:hypothetical protein
MNLHLLQKRVVSYKSPVDPDYQAVLDRAVFLGYSVPSESQQIKQGNLITSLKSVGIWAKLDVFYNFANNGGADFGRLNWKNPSLYESTLVNTVPFTINEGFEGNASNSYLNTNYNPLVNGVNFQRDNASVYIWLNKAATLGTFRIAVGMGINNVSICNESNVRQRLNQSSFNLSTAVDLGGTGMKSINRATSTGTELFNNKTQFSRTINSQAVINATTVLFASSNLWSNAQASMLAHGASLIAENDDFVDIYQNYIDSL